MNSARVTIGRVRMKAGGAEVRVLRSPVADTECRRRLRSWASAVLSEPGPHAFFAIAFRIDPHSDYQGGTDTTFEWYSERVELQTDMLPVLACRAITRQIGINAAESVVMRELGYKRSDDPDPSA